MIRGCCPRCSSLISPARASYPSGRCVRTTSAPSLSARSPAPFSASRGTRVRDGVDVSQSRCSAAEDVGAQLHSDLRALRDLVSVHESTITALRSQIATDKVQPECAPFSPTTTRAHIRIQHSRFRGPCLTPVVIDHSLGVVRHACHPTGHPPHQHRACHRRTEGRGGAAGAADRVHRRAGTGCGTGPRPWRQCSRWVLAAP